MTTLTDKIEALAKDVGDPETVARMLRGVGIFPGTAAFVEEIPTILRALRERDQAVEALWPFAEYGKWAVNENGWDLGSPRERLCDWFGPSDFHRAATTLASIEGTEHE